MEKSLSVSSPEELKAASPDVKLVGDPNAWICISKASSERQGWMHSTKVACVRGLGLLVQTSTELRHSQGNPATSQGLAFIPGAYLDGRTIEGVVQYEMRQMNDGDRSPGYCYIDDKKQTSPATQEAYRAKHL